MELLRIENLGKTYRSREGDVTALEDISLSIEKGDIFGIIGLSEESPGCAPKRPGPPEGEEGQ